MVHDQGSNFKGVISVEEEYLALPCIKITDVTNNFFDWLSIIEYAEKIYMVDSLFSNIVEQMNIDIKKKFFLRSNCYFTPVLNNKWEYS